MANATLSVNLDCLTNHQLGDIDDEVYKLLKEKFGAENVDCEIIETEEDDEDED